jgi:hypothetical protein
MIANAKVYNAPGVTSAIGAATNAAKSDATESGTRWARAV